MDALDHSDYCRRLTEKNSRHRRKMCERGAAAAPRLMEEAWQLSYQGRIVRRFLLGLFDSQHFPFDLDSLNDLTIKAHADCIDVLQMQYAHERDFLSCFEGGRSTFVALICFNHQN